MSEKDGKSSKKKLFAVLEILKKYSDDEHPMKAHEIIEKLSSEYDLAAERKSIYRDVETLQDMGVDIMKSGREGFYLAARSFEIAEIRMLNDAILGASFITPSKTKVLSHKLTQELSVHQAKQIETQMYYDNRIKFDNEQILYIVDQLHTAIAAGKKVKFKYYRKRIVNNRVRRTYTREHCISPYALIWSDDNYYLVGNYGKYDNLSHYRLDRMEQLSITDEPSRSFEEVSKYRGSFDAGDYVTHTFRMYSGEETEIDLICSNDILEKIIDKFGDGAHYMNCENDTFRVRTTGYMSEGLVDWLMMYSSRCYIKAPDELRERVIRRAAEIVEKQSEMV